MGLLWNLFVLSILGLVIHEVVQGFFLKHPSELQEPLVYAKRLLLESWRTVGQIGENFAASWR